MSEHTNETTIANLRETLARVTAERDGMREVVAAVDAWGRSYWAEDGVRDMVGMNSATMAHNANQERLLALWKQRHPEFFKKGEPG